MEEDEAACSQKEESQGVVTRVGNQEVLPLLWGKPEARAQMQIL
jgi:hypothetical protein